MIAFTTLFVEGKSGFCLYGYFFGLIFYSYSIP
nr:MAG TPA: hypothetical protein [Caudoviricetes sp.]